MLLLAIAILPWVAVSRVGEWRPPSPPSVADTSAAIEALTSMLVVAADRPSLSFHAKRADGIRLVATPSAGRLGVSPPSLLARKVRAASAVAPTVPLARHLAGRGPPLLAAA